MLSHKDRDYLQSQQQEVQYISPLLQQNVQLHSNQDKLVHLDWRELLFQWSVWSKTDNSFWQWPAPACHFLVFFTLTNTKKVKGHRQLHKGNPLSDLCTT